MALAETDNWQGVTDPTSGKPFTDYGSYSTWASAQVPAGGGMAKGSAVASASPTPTGQAPNATIDWSKTGWNIDYTGDKTTNANYYRPPDNTFGFQIGDTAGYINPTTGEISYGTKQQTGQTGYPEGMYGTGYLGNEIPGGNQGMYGTTTGTYQYDVNTDYGLGSGAIGIIPLEHNAQGQVSWYLAPTSGGGFARFPTLAEAQKSLADFKAWAPTTKTGSMGVSPTPATPAAATTATTPAESTTPGVLMNPGATENYYDSTKDFYTQPTNAQKTWDETANQPSKIEQTWNAQSGNFNQPSNAEDLYSKYSSTFSDPHYLDSYWDTAQKNAAGAQAARAASAGVGDSSMAMRAGSNLGSVYDQNRLQSMQQFATTGMGLATAADTGLNQRIAGQETLAGLTDKGANDRVATANTVDQGTLNKTLGGQNASSVAQSAEEKRLSGGLTSSQSLASDQATLVGFGLSQAQSEQFTTDLQAIQLGLSKGTLTFNQAMAQATEKANLTNTASNAYFQYWLASKLMGGSTSSYSPDVSTGNSGTASTTGFDANGNYTGGVA